MTKRLLLWIWCGILTSCLTGCPIPIPRTTIIQPKLTIQVLDEKGRALPNQWIWFSWLSHPHRRVHRVQHLKSDQQGQVILTQKTKREWIMPLMMHGVPQHFWSICLKRRGYQTILRSYYLQKKKYGAKIVLLLKPGKSKGKCSDIKVNSPPK